MLEIMTADCTCIRKTGYDVNAKGRLPDCLVEWSAKRLKRARANAVKFLLYYDVDDTEEINIQKKAYIERVVQNVLPKIFLSSWKF